MREREDDRDMKIKNGFVLREVAGKAVVIAVGEASKSFHGMINLNGTGRDIWQGISDRKSVEEIATKLTKDYEVDFEKAKQDTEKMIGTMREAGILEE